MNSKLLIVLNILYFTTVYVKSRPNGMIFGVIPINPLNTVSPSFSFPSKSFENQNFYQQNQRNYFHSSDWQPAQTASSNTVQVTSDKNPNHFNLKNGLNIDDLLKQLSQVMIIPLMPYHHHKNPMAIAPSTTTTSTTTTTSPLPYYQESESFEQKLRSLAESQFPIINGQDFQQPMATTSYEPINQTYQLPKSVTDPLHHSQGKSKLKEYFWSKK